MLLLLPLTPYVNPLLQLSYGLAGIVAGNAFFKLFTSTSIIWPSPELSNSVSVVLPEAISLPSSSVWFIMTSSIANGSDSGSTNSLLYMFSVTISSSSSSSSGLLVMSGNILRKRIQIEVCLTVCQSTGERLRDKMAATKKLQLWKRKKKKKQTEHTTHPNIDAPIAFFCRLFKNDLNGLSIIPNSFSIKNWCIAAELIQSPLQIVPNRFPR